MPTPTLTDGVREITDAEVAAYQRNGWAALPGLVQPAVVATLLERLRGHMGHDAEIEVIPKGQKTPRPPEAKKIFTVYDDPSRDDEVLGAFTHSRGVGRVLTRAAARPVRFWGTSCFVKMPVGRAGGKTPWHQDWPYYPFDRTGSLNLWIALVDIPAEMGTMRFVNGSHLWGPHGRVIHRTDGKDTLDLLPAHLRARVEFSPPRDMKAGDATIHDDLTIHSAPPNTTDQPRWAYSIMGFPADTLFTNGPQRRTRRITHSRHLVANNKSRSIFSF